MKKLTLDKTWELCLEQWRWIMRQLKIHPYSNIAVLKEKWMKKNGIESIMSNCFFCHHDTRDSPGCSKCPARKIDKSFHCYGNKKYHYAKKPAAFLKEITRLNKIRLAKKKK